MEELRKIDLETIGEKTLSEKLRNEYAHTEEQRA